MDEFLKLWPVIQTVLGIFVGVIAYMAKQSVVRAEQSTREVRVSIDAMRTEASVFATQVAVTNERIIAHQQSDDRRFEAVEERINRVQADHGNRLGLLEQAIIRNLNHPA